jgi:ferredoxin
MLSKKLARVDRKRCVSCGACTKACPLGASQIWRGCFAQVDDGRCVGCGKCAAVCPADCITIVQREGAV